MSLARHPNHASAFQEDVVKTAALLNVDYAGYGIRTEVSEPSHDGRKSTVDFQRLGNGAIQLTSRLNVTSDRFPKPDIIVEMEPSGSVTVGVNSYIVTQRWGKLNPKRKNLARRLMHETLEVLESGQQVDTKEICSYPLLTGRSRPNTQIRKGRSWH